MRDDSAQAMSFRRAGPGDSRRIWAWRNEPSVRAVSLNAEEIPFDAHEQWFARKVDDPRTHLLIATVSEGTSSTDIGYVRFDVTGPTAEISVCLDPAFRGRGFGRAAIRLASGRVLREAHCERIVAIVKPDNAASVAAFVSVGFVLQSTARAPHAGLLELHLIAPSVLFRVDAGPGIGLGHLQRCLSLAAALAESGCAIAFLVNDRSMVAGRVAAAGWPVAVLAGCASWTNDDADRVVHEIAARRASIVIVDSDLESPAYMRRLKSAGVVLCSVEDNSQDDVVAHVLLNGDAHARLQRYTSEGGDTEFLLGPSFAPLAREYWAEARTEAAVPPRAWLLTLGGSDPQGLMPALITAACGAPSGVHLHVVVGPFTGSEAVEAALHQLTGRVTVHRAPVSMFSIISACDLAISAAGQTLYELAALGRPVVAIETAANQIPQLDEFILSGAVIRAGGARDAGIAERAIAMAADLAAQPARLHAMAAAGRAFIDGQGARRAAERVLAGAARAQAFNPPSVAVQP